MKIEDYALIGDTHTAALVGKNGSIDWLCLPRFDSGACFAALLGREEHGCWQLAPAGEVLESRRAYREGTLVLESEFRTAEGRVKIVDCMKPRETHPELIRVVKGLGGRVRMKMRIIIRFDYGTDVPWVRQDRGHLVAVAGPNAIGLWSDVEMHGERLTTLAEFEVEEGDEVAFILNWHPSHEPIPKPSLSAQAIEETTQWWRAWIRRSTYDGLWEEAVNRSLLTLKAMTYAPTGGIVAAPTTSLPVKIGGVRNWDYRYCWLRDATFTLYALMTAGYTEEAVAWRDWLLRAAAGSPGQIKIMYGAAGERHLHEVEMPALPGYEDSRPVRIGNAASEQFQLDVYGEVMDVLHLARSQGIEPERYAWRLQCALMEFLESHWQEPDEGIWEVRGPRRHFTHSKIMAWVAFDRAVKAVKNFKLDGPVDRWRALRDEIHQEVCRRGFHEGRQAFTREFGSDQLDASLLMTALVGFLPPEDPRIHGTIRAIEEELTVDGFVMRNLDDPEVTGLPPGDGTFLLCSFWLADNLALTGRRDDAIRLFERLLSIRNDVGLLSEEYDPRARRFLGNFPQAFSHVGLINTARNLSRSGGPAEKRPGKDPEDEL